MVRRALILLAAITFTACKTEVLPAVAPAPLAACLTFVVKDDKALTYLYDRDVQTKVRTAVEVAFVAAGFNVVSDVALPHDIVAEIQTAPGSRVEAGARVQVKLAMGSRGKPIDTIEANAPLEGGGYDAYIAEQLVDAVFRSPGLAAFTKDLRKPGSGQHLASSGMRASDSACAPLVPAASVAPVATVAVPVAPAPTAAAPEEFTMGAAQPAAFALIVGVEDYRTLPKAIGGKADAERFARFARRSLGIPDAHIKLVVGEKADKLAFDLTYEWIKLNIPVGGRIYFYFSGHGALKRSTEYLLPYDGDAKSLDTTGVSLPAFLQELSATRAKQVIAIVDAGFSGAGPRSVAAPDARAPASINDPEVAPRTVLLSAVTSADTEGVVTSPVPGGVFTHYLLDGIASGRADVDGDGQITLHEAIAWCAPRIGREAKRQQRTQVPSILGGPAAGSPAQIMFVSGLPVQ